MPFSPSAWFESNDWPDEAIFYQVDPRIFGGRYIVDMATLIHERDSETDLVLAAHNSGTFAQIAQALDAIRDLGCNTLWVMPPFLRGELGKKGAGSPYAVRDYGRLQPELGSDDRLRALVAEAHGRDMKVIIGFVPNHVARDSVLLPLHRPPEDAWFYCSRHDPSRLYHDDDWSDTVKLNYANPRVREHVIETMINVLRRYDLDGMRCDMAHLVRRDVGRSDLIGGGYPDFWREALPRVRAAIPRRLLFLAEVYGTEEALALIDHGFDAVYQKELFDVQLRRLRDENASFDFQTALRREIFALGDQRRVLRFAENHDDARAVQIFGGFAEARLAAALTYVLPSLCMVYSGQEYGSFVKPSITELYEPVDPPGVESLLGTVVPIKPVRRMTYRFFRKMLGLRREHDAFRHGRFVQLRAESLVEGHQTGRLDEYVVALTRYVPQSGEAFVVALNYDRRHERWVTLSQAFTTQLREVLREAGIEGGFHVEELLEARDFGARHAHEPLLVRLRPLECQVLRLRRTG